MKVSSLLLTAMLFTSVQGFSQTTPSDTNTVKKCDPKECKKKDESKGKKTKQVDKNKHDNCPACGRG